MHQLLRVIWGLPLILYAGFWLWYTPLGGPLTAAEIDDMLAGAEARDEPAENLELLRRFLEEDDGRSFVMVNIIDLSDAPPDLPATGPGASAGDLMDHYLEYMFPALFRRASHPVFFGTAVSDSVDIVGIENAEVWDMTGLMRYRSRRDLWEIASHPSFEDRHKYKIGALDKTVAFPVRPTLFLSDPRLLLGLIALLLASLLERLVRRPR
ncbi:MAG: hypothetical protein AAF498_16230 [Pseudomonadota bacterium]